MSGKIFFDYETMSYEEARWLSVLFNDMAMYKCALARNAKRKREKAIYYARKLAEFDANTDAPPDRAR